MSDGEILIFKKNGKWTLKFDGVPNLDGTQNEEETKRMIDFSKEAIKAL